MIRIICFTSREVWYWKSRKRSLLYILLRPARTRSAPIISEFCVNVIFLCIYICWPWELSTRKWHLFIRGWWIRGWWLCFTCTHIIKQMNVFLFLHIEYFWWIFWLFHWALWIWWCIFFLFCSDTLSTLLICLRVEMWRIKFCDFVFLDEKLKWENWGAAGTTTIVQLFYNGILIPNPS